MKFYEISTKKNTPTAYAYGPEPMGYELESSFNLLTPVPGFLSIESKSGTKWYDQLYQTGLLSLRIFSGRVVDKIKNNALTGTEFYPLNLSRVEAKKLSRENAPDYFWMRVTASLPALIIYFETGEEVKKHPDSQVYDIKTTIGQRKKIRFKLDDDQMPDFFYARNSYAARRYCSQRFVDLVEKNGWTNFNFYKQDEDGWLNF